MMKKLFAVLGVVVLLTGCASTKQYVPFPDQSVEIEDPEKVRIYLFRPSSFGSAVSMKVYDNHKKIGQTGPKGYLCWEREPGDILIESKAENKPQLFMQGEAGDIFYIKQKVKMGIMMARTDIDQIDKTMAEEYKAKCKPPKNASSY